MYGLRVDNRAHAMIAHEKLLCTFFSLLLQLRNDIGWFLIRRYIISFIRIRNIVKPVCVSGFICKHLKIDHIHKHDRTHKPRNKPH